MQRILFFHHVSVIGGGSYCLLNLISNLDRRVFDPVVVLREQGPLSDEIIRLGIRVKYFPSMCTIPYNRSLFKRGVLEQYMEAFKDSSLFRELIISEHADLIYLNNMMLAHYLKPAKELGCKTILHVREHWPLHEHRFQLNIVRRIVYTYCDRLVTINMFSSSMFPKMEATVVYDWIDMSTRYKPIPMSSLFGEDMKGKKVLLYTGGFQRIKGADYVINAFSEQVKGEEYRLLVLGANEIPTLTGLKQRFLSFLEIFGVPNPEKRMIEHLSNDRRIRLAPAIYELGHLIEQSHCFISYYRTPHANLALAENIIMMNPCIAANTEEAQEYSGNGQYAMLVPMQNYALFKKQLGNFLSNIGLWEKAAAAGSEHISSLFDKEQNIKKYIGVLNSLV